MSNPLLWIMLLTGKLASFAPYIALVAMAAMGAALLTGFVSIFRPSWRATALSTFVFAGVLYGAAFAARHGPQMLALVMPGQPVTLAHAVGISASSVVDRAGTFWLTIEARPASDEDIPNAAATAFKKAGQWLADSAITRLGKNDVVVEVNANTVDKYGNSQRVAAGAFRWANADIRRIKWDALPTDALLPLATIEAAPAIALSGLRRWCATHYLRHGQSPFCNDVAVRNIAARH